MCNKFYIVTTWQKSKTLSFNTSLQNNEHFLSLMMPICHKQVQIMKHTPNSVKEQFKGVRNKTRFMSRMYPALTQPNSPLSNTSE